jgi:hypothetical protein
MLPTLRYFFTFPEIEEITYHFQNYKSQNPYLALYVYYAYLFLLAGDERSLKRILRDLLIANTKMLE